MADTKKEKPDVPGVDVPDADGDKPAERDKFAEPKGTVHTDQYNTQFPGERTVRKP